MEQSSKLRTTSTSRQRSQRKIYDMERGYSRGEGVGHTMIQFIYNSLYSYDTFGIIAKTVVALFYPRRLQVLTGPRRFDFSDDTYDNIIIPVVIQYADETFEDLRTRARRFWQASYKPLVFTDEPDKYYLGKIYDAVSMEKIVNLAPGK